MPVTRITATATVISPVASQPKKQRRWRCSHLFGAARSESKIQPFRRPCTMKLCRISHALAVAGLFVAASVACAADFSPAPVSQDKLATARGLIAESRWAAAIDELKRVGETGSADWNNLMGYSLRKARTPDYAAAERFYDEALRIEPQHRGALEYSGELYLMTGNLAKAEARLSALDKACRLPCEEYSDLKKAIERYKANGNRYVQTAP
jgi:tetratricopeptide (TPR) repeat protein